MESYLSSSHYDLVSPDGYIFKIEHIDESLAKVIVEVKEIAPVFRGFEIDLSLVTFNLKSTLAQLGLNSVTRDIEFSAKHGIARISLDLMALHELAKEMLALLKVGAYIGKLFAADQNRSVRNPDYLLRMLGRSDRRGRPLLAFGSDPQKDVLILEKIEGRTVAFLPLLPGCVEYNESIHGFLPTMAEILSHQNFQTRDILQLHQRINTDLKKQVHPKEVLLVKTEPLHIRTAFARVAEELLPKGFHHTSANILQPDTLASGDIYELYGSSEEILEEIPLEFFTLEPHREHVFFADRDQLQIHLENSETIFHVFKTAPKPDTLLASVFIVKGEQLENLKEKDWITRDPVKESLPGLTHPARQAFIVKKYIEEQSSYPFLKAIEDGLIRSQGVLFTRYLPSPLMKRMLLSDQVQKCLKGIYFLYPSRSQTDFFSYEDRAMLIDLERFAIPIYWVDQKSKQVLQYIVKPGKDSGMFVPLSLVEDFRKATTFGVYGSNLIEGNFENELHKLLKGIQKLQKEVDHPLLNAKTPLALVTGGGPGAMELGNRVAKNVGFISCANIVDFSSQGKQLVNEQKMNPHVDAKMTYRLDHLVERQAEFHLDFPIFLMGGIGMDFEYALEEVRRKVGASPAYPVLLFGEPSYWKEKVTPRFQSNLKRGTIQGSEWVSNCFYCIETAEQGLSVYRKFFKNELAIGKEGPIYENGFCIVASDL